VESYLFFLKSEVFWKLRCDDYDGRAGDAITKQENFLAHDD